MDHPVTVPFDPWEQNAVAEMSFDVAVVGAGVVGLASAEALARAGRSVVVLERHDGICRETSSRNSEVVHAGIYYPPGSLKARSCVRGKELLYARCDAQGIDAPRVGKLIVAYDTGEIVDLQRLKRTAEDNGVTDLELIDGAALREREPAVSGVAAIYSPSTGIVDSHRFAASFQAGAERHGADVVFRTEVVGVEASPGGYRLMTSDPSRPEDRFALEVGSVVNAAGLGQPHLSELVGLDLDGQGLRQYPCKGSYFLLATKHWKRFRSLVYPVGKADAWGLGVHTCMDVGGGIRLGPDGEYVDGPPFDYRVDPARRHAFLESARRFLPWLEADDLQPDQSGVRPKLFAAGGSFRDFVVREESGNGLPGWVTLAGIESPGLTAAGALAEEVLAVLGTARTL